MAYTHDPWNASYAKKKLKKAYLLKQGNRSWPSRTVTLNFDPKSRVNPFEKI